MHPTLRRAFPGGMSVQWSLTNGDELFEASEFVVWAVSVHAGCEDLMEIGGTPIRLPVGQLTLRPCAPLPAYGSG